MGEWRGSRMVDESKIKVELSVNYVRTMAAIIIDQNIYIMCVCSPIWSMMSIFQLFYFSHIKSIITKLVNFLWEILKKIFIFASPL